MTVTYPPIDQWVVSERVFQCTLEGVWPAGRCGRESGAFWLGRREKTSQISAVVLPRGAGVEERPNCWRVSPEVFGAITRWATPQGLCLLAVVHTHVRGVPAFLSWTDRNFGVRVPGVLAIVIGGGGDEYDYHNWGWYVFEGDDYRRFSQSEIGERLKVDGSGDFKRGTADANGVRPLADK
jgi:hypothetical protein